MTCLQKQKSASSFDSDLRKHPILELSFLIFIIINHLTSLAKASSPAQREPKRSGAGQHGLRQQYLTRPCTKPPLPVVRQHLATGRRWLPSNVHGELIYYAETRELTQALSSPTTFMNHLDHLGLRPVRGSECGEPAQESKPTKEPTTRLSMWALACSQRLQRLSSKDTRSDVGFQGLVLHHQLQHIQLPVM